MERAFYERFSFYELFGFHTDVLALVVILLAAISFNIPVIGWRLQQRGQISALAQRRVEVSWLMALTLVACGTWVIYVLDFCHRIRPYRSPPLFGGYMAAIAVVQLNVAAYRRWRRRECLTGHCLCRSILLAILQLALFYACLCAVMAVGVAWTGPIGPYFPDWILVVFLAAGVALHVTILLCIRKYWRRRRPEVLQMTTDRLRDIVERLELAGGTFAVRSGEVVVKVRRGVLSDADACFLASQKRKLLTTLAGTDMPKPDERGSDLGSEFYEWRL